MLSAFPFHRLRFSLSDRIDQLTSLTTQTKCDVVVSIHDTDKGITRLSNNNFVITITRSSDSLLLGSFQAQRTHLVRRIPVVIEQDTCVAVQTEGKHL